MKFLKIAIPMILLAACALGQSVRFNFDEQADFSKYRTYKWAKHPESVKVDDLTLGILGAAFEAELAKKGLTKAESGESDMVIVYQVGISQEREITSYDTGWGYGPGWRRGWYGTGGGMTTSTTNTINVGELALDMYDSAKHELVWRGVASKTLDMKASQDKMKKNSAKAAQKMLKNYPPKPKKK